MTICIPKRRSLLSRTSRLAAGVATIACWLSAAGGVARAGDAQQANLAAQDRLWQQSVELIGRGDFDRASETINGVTLGGPVSEQVRTWLSDYRTQEEMRRELNRADFDKYIGYCNARIERREYREALEWVLRAADVAEDREVFLDQGGWLDKLVNDSLAQGEQFCKDSDWHGAWNLYWRLNELYDRQPRFRKLERAARTHLRLDLVFEKGSRWRDSLDRVRWEDAERAFQYLDIYYVVPVNFKEVAQAGLEQLLLLSESKTAQETFEGLGDPEYRQAFQDRVRYRLDQILASDTVSRNAAIQCFRRVVSDINEQTVQLPEELIVSELIRGAFEPLDDFTSVFWPSEAEEFEKHTNGEFIGVGISIIKNALNEIEVSSPMEDTPAYRAGIQSGDIIIKADEVDLKGYSLTKAVKVITGPKGTPVKLTIRRGDEEIEFNLVRDTVQIFSVKGARRDENVETRWDYWLDKENRIAYVRVANFQANTVAQLYSAIAELRDDGVKGLILDLRRNPGGLLNSAYAMASLFLDAGKKVVSTRGRDPADNLDFRTRQRGPFADLPLVVLVDENSASGSEIVAGAIRDNARGTVIGARTYGKFSVQNLVPLGRTNAKLKITTARYHLPSGVSLHREPDSQQWGVDPDIAVRLATRERINVYMLWREADRIGTQATDRTDDRADEGTDDGKDESEPDSKTAEKVAVEGAEKEGARDEAAREVSRFKVKGFFLPRLIITQAEDDKDAPPVVKLDEEEQTLVATDAQGRQLRVTSAQVRYGELEIVAVNDGGEEVEVAGLTVGDKVATRIELPRLIQPDENNRPMIDPQLDAALLVMRAKLLGEWFPKLATADLQDKTEPVTP